jgi:hypothetical protein
MLYVQPECEKQLLGDCWEVWDMTIKAKKPYGVETENFSIRQ